MDRVASVGKGSNYCAGIYQFNSSPHLSIAVCACDNNICSRMHILAHIAADREINVQIRS